MNWEDCVILALMVVCAVIGTVAFVLMLVLIFS